MSNRIIIIFYFLLAIASVECYAQNIAQQNQVYKKKGKVYLTQTNQPFTGYVEARLSSGKMLFKKGYVQGKKISYTLYYDYAKGNELIRFEKFYNANKKIVKSVYYTKDQKTKYVTEFEENGDKKLKEEYHDGAIYYHCEYLNNKKHGKVYGYDQNGNPVECHYENGKFIK